MKKIDTLEKLRIEKKRLQLRAETLEVNIKNDYENVKESMKPLNMVIDGFNKSVSGDKHNLFGETMNIGIDIIFRKIILRNQGLLMKLIVPYLVKNFTGNYLKDHRKDVISWLRNKISTAFTKNGKETYYDKSTADLESNTW